MFFLLEWYPQTKQPFEVYSTNPKLTKNPSTVQFHFCRASMAILYLFMTILIWESHTNHGDLGYVSSHSWTWSKRRSSCMLVIWDHEDWSKWLRPSRDLVGRGGSGSGQVDCLWLASGHWRVQVFWASASSSCWQRTGSGRSSGYHQSHWESEGNLRRVLRGVQQSRLPASYIFITERRAGIGGKTEVAQNLLRSLNLQGRASLCDDNIEVAEEFCQAGGTVFHIKKPSLRGQRTKRVISFVWDVHPFIFEGWTPN